MENYIVKFDIYMGFCTVQNEIFSLAQNCSKIPHFYVIFQNAKLKENKIFCTWENML
jgi:hypothetical protein